MLIQKERVATNHFMTCATVVGDTRTDQAGTRQQQPTLQRAPTTAVRDLCSRLHSTIKLLLRRTLVLQQFYSTFLIISSQGHS